MSAIKYVKAGSATGVKTRVVFPLVVDATDGITAETGEAGGQPQISVNGAAWTSTGIGTLAAIGNGSYYADLTALAVAVAGVEIRARYKSSNTAEARGTTYIVTALDPFNETQTVSLGSATIGSAQIADGAITAAKFGAGAVTSTVLADGAVTSSKLADGLITAAKLASGVFTAAKFATAALVEGVFGSNAFTASKFAADVNTYVLNARLVQVDANTQHYVVWFTKNGGASVGFDSITGTPTIVATGDDDETLVSSTALTSWGVQGKYYYEATGDARVDAGHSAELVVTATIDGVALTRSAVIEKNNNA